MEWTGIKRPQKGILAMPMFEVKYHDFKEWKDISEIELMDGLYKVYRKASPAVKEMITGKEIFTPEAVYRLKFNCVEPGDMSKPLNKVRLTKALSGPTSHRTAY